MTRKQHGLVRTGGAFACYRPVVLRALPLVLTILLSIFASERAAACSCRKDPREILEELREGADVAFIGTVVEVGEGPSSICDSEPRVRVDPQEDDPARVGDICELDPEACPPGPCPLVRIEVLEAQKGPQQDYFVVIPDGMYGMGCDAPYQVGHTFQVFGGLRNGYVFSWPCGSHEVARPSAAEEEISKSPPPRGRGGAGCSLGRASAPDGLVLVLLLLVFSRWKRRRPAPSPVYDQSGLGP